METRTGKSIALIIWTLMSAACQRPGAETDQPPVNGATTSGVADETGETAAVEILPGLSMRILRAGYGDAARTGQVAVVHYTGWLFDETVDDHRGKKFDSSLDRAQHFSFTLGARRVIRGWDEGVLGMKVGEVRELTIAPEMGYGDRGAGNVIPPGATLVFEIELAALQNPE